METIDFAPVRANVAMLTADLQVLRADVHVLAKRLASQFGEESEVTFRAGELAAAVQRLEWAVARSKADRAAHAAAGS
jgi:hypothetical protein